MYFQFLNGFSHKRDGTTCSRTRLIPFNSLTDSHNCVVIGREGVRKAFNSLTDSHLIPMMMERTTASTTFNSLTDSHIKYMDMNKDGYGILLSIP